MHSQDRPHFCPVEGCPRGVGGKGFKRKNEMMRHGLVHNSPGYVCPFCPDQQHKYPRPDNLQRYVTVWLKLESLQLVVVNHLANLFDPDGLILYLDMFEFITSIRTKTIPFFDKSLHNDLWAAHEAVGGD